MVDNVTSREMNTQMTFGYSLKVTDLRRFLQGLPENATITINRYNGDQRDPGYTTVKATWRESF